MLIVMKLAVSGHIVLFATRLKTAKWWSDNNIGKDTSKHQDRQGQAVHVPEASDVLAIFGLVACVSIRLQIPLHIFTTSLLEAFISTSIASTVGRLTCTVPTDLGISIC